MSSKDKIEDIAVVGLALRFPQDATSADAFWQMIMESRSAKTNIPKERFNIDSFHREGSSKTAAINAKGGHFMKEDIAAFDAPFFAMTPAEAECTDPMQRLLLEVTYEALENAGIPMENIRGSKTSVHIGAFLREYEILLSRDPQIKQTYKAPGTAFAMLSNRLSWFFDLMGPSVSIDTACSSSLYALHLSCQSIRSRETTMGIVGGCNLFYDPDMMTSLTDLNFLSPDSISYSFDHRANGYSRGEGFGIVLLKTLTKAIEDGNTIRAVIRSTGANHDGRTPGVTQPSSHAQQQLIQDTYSAANLDMSVTRYFEAHGTGTPIGDPLEARAIHSAFESSQSKDYPLLIGAVKSNIGHLEGAAGIASLIKTILVLERGVVPPNIWFEQVNPKIPAEKWNIKFPTKPEVWPVKGLRRASVNSFGFGGSNAHAILDDAFNYLQLRGLSAKHCTVLKVPNSIDHLNSASTSATDFQQVQSVQDKNSVETTPKIFVWSSTEESGLQRFSKVYANFLRTSHTNMNNPEFLDDLAYTLSEKRSKLPWKSFAVADSVAKLQQILEHGLSNPLRSTRAPKLCYVFTGQGAQWPGFGRELMEYSCFKNSLQSADLALRRLGCSWSLIEELLKDTETSRISEPAFSQPICTIVQIALVDLLSSWGILPTVVIGHSSGEIAAAYCTGSISRNSGWEIAYYRGIAAEALMESATTQMGMLSVGLSEAEMRKLLSSDTPKLPGSIGIACINSQTNVTISGETCAIDMLENSLRERDIFARRLKVNIAYHSNFMDSVATLYADSIGTVHIGTPLESHPVMYSSVTGKLVETSDLCQTSYWVSNMVSPVRFLDAVSHIGTDSPKTLGSLKSGKATDRVDSIVEIGPHSTLQGPLKEIMKSTRRGNTISYGTVLSRHKSAISTALDLVGKLHTIGYPVNIATVNERGQPKQRSMLTNLPSYPFNHSKTYWLESRLSRNFRFRKHPHHELLGSTVPDWNELDARWRNLISLDEHPWVKDHKVNGLYVYPAAGMLVMAIEAARQLSHNEKNISSYHFKDVAFNQAIVLHSSDDKVETEICLRPQGKMTSSFLNWIDFKLFTYMNDTSSEVCSGLIAIEYKDSRNEIIYCSNEPCEQKKEYETGAAHCLYPVMAETMYSYFSQIGLKYGPVFQNLNDIWCSNTGQAIASIDLQGWKSRAETPEVQPHFIHPAALDNILQLSLVAMSNGGSQLLSTVVPTRIRSLRLSTVQGLQPCTDRSNLCHVDRIKVHARSEAHGFREYGTYINAIDSISGLSRIQGSFEVTSIGEIGDHAASSDSMSRLGYNVVWEPYLDLSTNEDIASFCTSRVDSAKFPPASAIMLNDKLLYCTIVLCQTNQALQSTPIATNNQTIAKYIGWMKYRLSFADLNIHVARSELERLSMDQEFVDKLQHRVENCDIEGRLMVRVGLNLKEVLFGAVNALELLFNDSIMTEYYRGINDKACSRIKVYVDSVAHKNPGMRILEVGAGTGSTTSEFLNVLTRTSSHNLASPRFSKYVFTDLSPSFFKDAKEMLQGFGDRIDFAVLDIGKDPIKQGFEESGYDMIIASNVLHATPHLVHTLENTRRLLKPGGKLVLYELINQDTVRHGFTFGILPGWWLAVEQDRQWCPLVTEEYWDGVLRRSGFSGVDFALRDYDDPHNHSVSAMVSTAIRDVAGSRQPSKLRVYLIVLEGSTSQRITSDMLKARSEEKISAETRIISLSDIDNNDFEGTACVFLPELETSVLNEQSQEMFSRLQKVITTAKSVLWVARESSIAERSPLHAMITGIRRVVSRELPTLKFATLFVQTESNIINHSQILHIVQVLELTMGSNGEKDLEYRVEDGRIYIPRLVGSSVVGNLIAEKRRSQTLKSIPFKYGHKRALKITMKTPGALDSFCFKEDESTRTPLADTEIEIEIHASGLNFKDVLVAIGNVSEGSLGIECSGLVTQSGARSGFNVGERVCAIVDGSLGTYVRCEAHCATVIPENVTLVEAAGLPVVFSTAYHSIMSLARMKPGERILIHSGAGGLGQASIQIARLLGAEIFTTVGSLEKKQFLISEYGIQEDHIFSSRTPEFVHAIKRLTNGDGVDVIINTLAGEGLRNSWECIAPFGRFIEASAKDILENGRLPMEGFMKGASFVGIDLKYIKNHLPNITSKLLRDCMALLSDRKIAIPAPLHTLPASKIETAFRMLQGGTSKGKVIIKFDEDDVVQALPSSIPQYSFNSNYSYIIAGGLGGLGKSITNWMVRRGAKNLVLLSRGGGRDTSSMAFLENARAQGVNCVALSCDIADTELLRTQLEFCKSTLPPIKGCIQCAMVLRDSSFTSMTYNDFAIAVCPKVAGSWNLHQLLPLDLDFFIMLSSSAGIFGWHGQSNYASGNTYQDALARHLVRTQTRKAISLDLGGFRSAGYVANKQGLAEKLESQGVLVNDEADLHVLLEYYCNPNLRVEDLIHSQLVLGIAPPAYFREKNIDVPSWMLSPLFSHLLQMSTGNASSETTLSADDHILSSIKTLTSHDDISAVFIGAICQKLARTLVIDPRDVDADRPLHIYGVDSLSAVEIKSWMKRSLGCDIPVFEILSDVSISQLGRGMVDRCEALWGTSLDL